jgi:hypothetical protein
MFDSLFRVNGNATVAAGGNGDGQRNQLMDLRLQLAAFGGSAFDRRNPAQYVRALLRKVTDSFQ